MSRFFKLLACAFLFSLASNVLAQSDTLKPKQLLSDMTVQIECTEAIDSMYNFKFEVAQKQFTWLKQLYPEHPLAYFLLGLGEFWKIMPNDLNEAYDETFMAYMDTAIYKARALYKEDKTNPEATFFLAAAFGFKSRILSDRGHYARATVAAKASLNYLNENKTLNTSFSPEFLFGQGLYNYFREWIPENKKFLRPIVMFFPKGDKQKGIEQLKKVSAKAFYTRIEALNFLMSIYGTYEEKKKEAWPIAKQLHEQFPDNAYFHRYYVKMAYQLSKRLLLEKECIAVLKRVKSGKVGYEAESGRICSYYLGQEYMYRTDTTAAVKNFEECLKYAHEINVQHKGYCLFAYQYLAKIADSRDKKYEAYAHYKALVKAAGGENRDHKTVKVAKKYMRKNRKYAKKRK